MSRFAAVLVACWLLPAAVRAQGVAAPGTPAPVEVDVAAFVAQLDSLADATRSATTPADAAVVLGALPASWSVRAGAARFTVPSRPIADALRAAGEPGVTWDAARSEAVARVDALRAEANLLSAGGPPPPAHVRTALQDVLSAPEFRGRQRYAGLVALYEKVRDWVHSWFPARSRTDEALASGLRWFSWIVAALAFVLMAGLVWRLLRGVTREASIRVRPPRPAEAFDAGTWASRARAALAAGDAREAVRCAYHAMLHRLDEEGAWRLAEDRTPREYTRLLPPADRRQPAVAFVARVFEGIWYGGAEPKVDEARAAVSRLGDLGCDVHADPAT
jgi:hypothetical protein